MPPPRPSSDPKIPAPIPPAIIASPTTTSNGRQADSSRRCDGRRPHRWSGPQVLRRVREECDVTGALEGDRKLALVAGARAGLSARLDLRPFGQIATEAVDLLVVDRDGLVGAEGADLAATAVAEVVVSFLGAG